MNKAPFGAFFISEPHFLWKCVKALILTTQDQNPRCQFVTVPRISPYFESNKFIIPGRRLNLSASRDLVCMLSYGDAFFCVCGEGGCSSARSSESSRHAQPGAWLAHILIVGGNADVSSNVPTRTAVMLSLAAELANKCVPQVAQNRWVMWLPLSAVLVNCAVVPEISSASVATREFTVPFAEMRWQSRHQHTRVMSGSAERL